MFFHPRFILGGDKIKVLLLDRKTSRPINCVIAVENDTVKIIRQGGRGQWLGDYPYPNAFWPTPVNDLIASIRPYVLTLAKEPVKCH